MNWQGRFETCAYGCLDRVFVATAVGFDEGMRELGREIRDLHGRMNQRVAGVCDRVLLIVAGLPVGVKSEL